MPVLLKLYPGPSTLAHGFTNGSWLSTKEARSIYSKVPVVMLEVNRGEKVVKVLPDEGNKKAKCFVSS